MPFNSMLTSQIISNYYKNNEFGLPRKAGISSMGLDKVLFNNTKSDRIRFGRMIGNVFLWISRGSGCSPAIKGWEGRAGEVWPSCCLDNSAKWLKTRVGCFYNGKSCCTPRAGIVFILSIIIAGWLGFLRSMILKTG